MLLLYFIFQLSSSNVLNGICEPNIDFIKWQAVSPPNTVYKLLQSHILTRHGDRTVTSNELCWTEPQTIWNCSQTIGVQPNNIRTSSYSQNQHQNQYPLPFNFQMITTNDVNIFPGNCLNGQLTATGYQQQYENGNNFSIRYIDYYKILPSSLDDKTDINTHIYIHSDQSPRDQQSVMAFFEGLYRDRQNLTDLQYNVHLHSEMDYYDPTATMPNTNICPYLSTLESDMKNDPEYISHQQTVTMPLQQQASSFMYGGVRKASQIRDCGNVYSCHNYEVPQNFTQELLNELQADHAWYWQFENNYPNYTTAVMYYLGPLLKQITDRLEYVLEDNADYHKMWLYGVHDGTTIVPLLGAFGQNITNWVSYACFIGIELYESIDDKKYYLQISYNGDILQLPKQYCPSQTNNPYNLCEWDDFKKWMYAVIPDQTQCPGMKSHPVK